MMPHALLTDAKKASLTDVSTVSGGSSQHPLSFRFFGVLSGIARAQVRKPQRNSSACAGEAASVITFIELGLSQGLIKQNLCFATTLMYKYNHYMSSLAVVTHVFVASGCDNGTHHPVVAPTLCATPS